MIGCSAIARQYLDTAHRLDAIEIVAAAESRQRRRRFSEVSQGPARIIGQ